MSLVRTDERDNVGTVVKNEIWVMGRPRRAFLSLLLPFFSLLVKNDTVRLEWLIGSASCSSIPSFLPVMR